MSIIRNQAGQGIHIRAIDADGNPITEGVTAEISKDDGDFATSANPPVHKKSGVWRLPFSQAETNAASMAVLPIADGIIPDPIIIVTQDATISSRSTFDHTQDKVTVATNEDKSGYSLTQAFPENFASLGITAEGDIARVVANTDMRGTDGAYTGTPPTKEAIAEQVRTELTTELGRIDAEISSRLATASYTTPPTTGAIASQVRTELATELAHLDTDISSRLASSAYTAPPTAEAISTQVAADLEEAHGVGSWTTADTSGLSTLDGSAVYSAALEALDEYEPLPAGDYTAPDNAGIAAIKSQTDQLAFTGSDVKATLDGEKVTPIDVDGLTHASAVEAMLAVLLGKATVTDHGATRTATYTKQDGTTAKVTVTFDGDGNRTASTVS